MGKRINAALENTALVLLLGQIPPFTALPEEGVTIPIAIGLGLTGTSIYSAIRRVI